MFFLDNVLLGPIRILLLLLGVLFVHQIVTRQSIGTYNLNFILKRIVYYGSIILVVIFTLLQFKLYNIFTLMMLFLVLLGIKYLDVKRLSDSKKKINEKRHTFLIDFFRFIENNKDNFLSKYKGFFTIGKINYTLLAAFVSGLSVFVSRYFFLKNDLYTLSSLWLKNVEIVKNTNANIWFSKNVILGGELILINLYSKITGISEEMAIHSFGLIENFGLGVLLFWILGKITKSEFIAPLAGVLFFAFFYNYMPININILLEHNPVYLALCFALPAMLFTVIPSILTVSLKKYFAVLFFIFTAVALTNFFVTLFVVPVFLVLALVFHSKKNLSTVLRSILAYVLSVILVFGVYWLVCLLSGRSFDGFVRGNLVLVDTYTHFPQLFTTLDELLNYYTVAGILALVLILPLLLHKWKKWVPAFVFIAFFNVLMSFKYMNFHWLDVDLYYQSLSVFVVIIVGCILGVILNYAKINIPKGRILKPITLSLTFAGLLIICLVINSHNIENISKKDELKSSILSVYNSLSTENLPFSYGVVNCDYGQQLASFEHHFMNYMDFYVKYPELDHVYHKNKDDDIFLRENPSYILPKSIFVFVTNLDNSELDNHLKTPKDIFKNVESTIAKLKKEGRNVEVFYLDDYLTVYEIINKERLSNLNDLIFNL